MSFRPRAGLWIMFAHISGIPFEELLLPLSYGAGALLLAARAFGARILRAVRSAEAPRRSRRDR
jgi:hypothetical protein